MENSSVRPRARIGMRRRKRIGTGIAIAIGTTSEVENRPLTGGRRREKKKKRKRTWRGSYRSVWQWVGTLISHDSRATAGVGAKKTCQTNESRICVVAEQIP